MRPPLPSVLTRGTPAMGVGSSTPLRMMRSRPGRSVTSMLPSGRNARLHGCERPLVTTLTRIFCCLGGIEFEGPHAQGRHGQSDGRPLLSVADCKHADEHERDHTGRGTESHGILLAMSHAPV